MSTNHREDDDRSENRAPINSQNGHENNHYDIVPVPRPQPGNVITPRQERALRYLERKRMRQERSSQEMPAVQDATSIMEEEEVVLPPLPTRPTIPTGELELAKPRAVATVQSRRRRWQRKIMLRRISRKKLRIGRKEQRRSINRFWLLLSSIFFALLVLLLSVSGVSAFFAYRFYSDTQGKYIGQVASLRDLMPRDNLKMYDSKNVLLAQLTQEGLHTSVPLKNVAPTLVVATVSTEDKNFWNNPGIDLTRIIQAAIDDLTNGRVVAGGSTITQQLIKTLVVGNESSITRKLQELVLVPSLNSRYSKADIMEMYLNSIYYGEQAYGIDAAATIYFGLEDKAGKPAAQQLDLAQSAMLAGLPGLPDAYDPRQHPVAGFERFKNVLSFMLRDGVITRAQEFQAIEEAKQPHFFKNPASLVNRAPHFAEFVYKQLEQNFHMTRTQLARSDMKVYTTLDIKLQDQIQKIAQKHIAELRNAHHLSNAAEVLIDYHTGAIRSLLGSIDYNNRSIDGQFDVATQGYRQPGSSFKPFVYETAFQQGASPAQSISDEPTTINIPDSVPPTFSPTNYDERYHGHMTIRCALQNSLNVPAVRTLQHVGIDQAMAMAKNMGIVNYTGTPGYSLVLGGLGVRLLDETSAYGTFANSGVHVPYYIINKVVLSGTHQTYGHPNNTGTRVLSPQLAYMMTNVLSDNTSRLPEFYDCNVLQLYSNAQTDCWYGNRGAIRPAAVKTGTTNDFRDNWTVGYTTDYVMGVWAGNDDNTPMYNVTGVQGAAPIWHDSMLLAEQGRPIRNFTDPGGLVRAQVTYPDGVKSTDLYMPGTVPHFILPKPQPTVTPKASPTATPKTNPQAVITSSAVPAAYCPKNFSFAFSPPPKGIPSPIPGWW